MKSNSKGIALAVAFAALYAVLVLALAPISFELVQVRIADALIPLSIVFGWPAVAGVTVGTAIANVASPLPSVVTDITLGSLANLVAGMIAWKIGVQRRNKLLQEFLGCAAATAAVTFIVGTYLALLTGTDYWIWWLGIGIGSVISINIIGFALVKIFERLQAKTVVT